MAPLPKWPASPSSLQAVCVSFSKYELLSFTLSSLWPSRPAPRKEPATIRATSVRMGVAALKGIRTGSEGECGLEESRWACMSRGPRERLDPAQTACGLPFVHSFTHSLIHSTSPSPFSGPCRKQRARSRKLTGRGLALWWTTTRRPVGLDPSAPRLPHL